MKKVALYGGSFNPIHIGHLIIANYLCEWGFADEVWFLVSPQNPLKSEEELLPEAERLRLVKLAIQEYPRFKASDFEFHLTKPSYTIHTLDALKKAYPDHHFTLLMGADNWTHIHRWLDAERIIRENEVLIYPRPNHSIDSTTLPPTVQLIQAPLLEISSSAIRQALKEGKKPLFFLPLPVYYELNRKLFFRD